VEPTAIQNVVLKQETPAKLAVTPGLGLGATVHVVGSADAGESRPTTNRTLNSDIETRTTVHRGRFADACARPMPAMARSPAWPGENLRYSVEECRTSVTRRAKYRDGSAMASSSACSAPGSSSTSDRLLEPLHELDKRNPQRAADLAQFDEVEASLADLILGGYAFGNGSRQAQFPPPGGPFRGRAAPINPPLLKYLG
jgi:hypothetical protein